MRLEQLIDQLEAKIRDARKSRLLGGARVDREEIYDSLDAIRIELDQIVRPLDEHRVVRPGAGIRELADELDDSIHNARPVPLTDQVRVDREELLAIVSRMRECTRREEIVPRVRKPPYDPAPALALVEELERLVSDAPDVPLVGEARIERDAAYDLIDRMRSAIPEAAWAADEPIKTRLAGTLPLIDELDDRIHDARPVPLTSQVRVDRGKLSAILRQIRAAFSQGTLLALTN